MDSKKSVAKSETDMKKLATELAKDATEGSEMIVLTGSLPPGCPEGTYSTLMKALEGHKCILDTEGKELELCAKNAHPFLIKPNLREMEATLGIELRTMRTPWSTACRGLHGRHGSNVYLV